ncbi:MAG: rane protein-like protein [Solirubrobacterales bacterium]|nr:rane protein-like protein [Solirubrobacterales bacterium]
MWGKTLRLGRCVVSARMSTRRSVVALTLVALLLRVVTLDVQSYWSDEAATVQLLNRSFGGMLRGVFNGESTPPLYYVLAWLWTQVAGTGEVGTRLLSALISAATVPVVAALAARLVDVDAEGRGRAAVFAAALATVSPLTVWYGQEARAYALLMLLTAGSVLALLRALEHPSRGRLAAWATLVIAAMWTHHFALFIVVAEAGWALWVLRARALAAVGAAGVGAVALAPLLLHQRDAGRASFIAQESLGRRVAQVPKQVLVGYDAPVQTLLTVVGAVAVLVALAGLVRILRFRRAPRPPRVVVTVAAAGVRRPPPPGSLVVVTVAAAGVLLPLLAAAVGQDFVLTRNVVGVLPLVLALLAAGAVALPARMLGGAAVAALFATGLVCAIAVAADPIYQRDDFRAAVEAATRGAQGPRLVVADAEGRAPVRLYLGAGTRAVPAGVPVPVREIDVVKVAGARPGGARTTPRLPTDVVPPGFQLAGADTGDTWAVRRFVAPAPVPVDPGTLAPLDPGHPAVVLLRPR